MSFRVKIIVGMAFIQLSLLVVLITYGITVLRASNEEELIKRTQTTARLFASTAQPAVIASDIAALDSLIKEVLSNPGIVYARVVGPRGLLAEDGRPPALGRTFVADRDVRSARDEVFDTAADIVVAGERYGRVELGFSTAGIQQLVEKTRLRTVAISSVNILLVIFFSSVLGVYLTRGLKALQDGTRLISRGELGYQIPVKGSDELAETAADFNSMSSKLLTLETERARKEEEILRLNQELERRVDERTRQLSQLNQQLEHLAMHDALTQLPNRALFNDRLHTTLLAARREKTLFAVICVDLDLFKEINDTMGHHAGDMVLQHVAHACNRTVRDSDTVARIGGDEFAIIMPRVADVDSATAFAERLLEAIRQPLAVGEKWVQIGASLGISVYPEHGEYEQELQHHSDAAMYEAKRRGLGVVVYRHELGGGARQNQAAPKGESHHSL